MRSSILPLIFILLLSSCAALNPGKKTPINQLAPQPGMPLYSDSNLPFDAGLSSSVAKVYRGNSFLQSGAFISEKGLFLTSYPVVLDYFNNFSLGDNNWLESGYAAGSDSLELPLPGIMLMVLLEQEDVTAQIDEALPGAGNNYEFYQAKQAKANQLVAERKGGREDIFVQISELYSGNRQVLEVYQILNDVRLVFAPPSGIPVSSIGNSRELLHATTNKFAILRAYWSQDSQSVGFSTQNIAYKPTRYLPLSKKIKANGEIIALGYPDRTFRHEPSRALKFYNQQTNPYIIEAYQAYIKKEDMLSSQDPLYAIRTVGNRLHTVKELDHYHTIQQAFKVDSIIAIKDSREEALKNTITADTTLPPNFREIFHYVDQAYDIAEQQGSSFYITSYTMVLSALDEIASTFNAFTEADNSGKSEEQIATDLQSVVHTQQSILTNINYKAELELLKDFILILATLPEEKQLFSVLSIFEGVSPDDYLSRANDFITRNGANSVLFNPQAAADALLDGSISDDSLFTVLDEVIFTNKMSRNNQSIFMGYKQPAQQVYNQALLDLNATPTLTPDANGTLRTNTGAFSSNPFPDEQFLLTNNDFSGKSPGSVVLSENGILLGLISDERSDRVSSNYLYQPKKATVKAIRSDYIRSQLLGLAMGSNFLKELGL